MDICCKTWSRRRTSHRILRRAAVVIGFAGIGMHVAAEPVTIAFDDSVLVNDTVFTIGDIARVSGADAGIRDRVLATVAGTSAPPGYARFISTSEFVAGLLAVKFPELCCTLTGAKRPLIRTDYRMVKVADFEPDLQGYIAANLGWKVGEWRLEVNNPADSCKVYTSPVEVSFSGLDDRYVKGNSNLVMSLRQGARIWRIPVRCRFIVTTPVVVTRLALSRGQSITSGCFEIRTMDITRFAPGVMISPEQVLGKRAARSIEPGTILHDRLLTTIPAIEKGDAVSIIVSKGRITIAVSGIAREQGGIGDRIWVENRETRKLIRTEIIAKGRVTPCQGGVSI